MHSRSVKLPNTPKKIRTDAAPNATTPGARGAKASPLRGKEMSTRRSRVCSSPSKSILKYSKGYFALNFKYLQCAECQPGQVLVSDWADRGADWADRGADWKD